MTQELELMDIAERFRKKRILVMTSVGGFLLWMAIFVLNKKIELCSNEYLWWVLILLGPYSIFTLLQYRCPSCGGSPDAKGTGGQFSPEKCANCNIRLR